MRLPRFRLPSLCAVVALSQFALHGEPAPSVSPPPAEAFFSPAGFITPKLSPDGTKLCALTRFDDKDYALTLIELPGKRARTLVRTPDLSVTNFWWKNDDLLLILIRDDTGMGNFRSLDLRTGKLDDLTGLLSYRELELVNDLPADPEQMLFRSTSVNTTDHDIIKVNIRTGKETRIENDPGGVLAWLVNRSGEAVAGWGLLNDRWFLLWRPSAGAQWQRTEQPKNKLPEFVPMAVAPDQRRLIIKDFSRSPIARICYFDPATGAREEVAAPGEVEPRLEFWGSTHEPAALVYEADRTRRHFVNPDAESAHQWLEQALPDTEREFVSFSRDNSSAIVFAHNSRNPGIYGHVNFATKKVALLAPLRSAINPAAMAPGRYFTFTASDGLTIPGRITLPVNATKPPLILLIPSSLAGPRSGIGFDQEAQFFASHGYAAVRLDHRGMAGLGRDFAAAGDFQAGTGMVRDLTEGVKWLDAQGWIDPKRVAVYGERSGGWIAFQLATKPDVVRALINFNTPVDLTSDWKMSFFATSGRSEDDLLAVIGSGKAAAAYPKSISPLVAADQLSIPSFHFYFSGRDAGKLKPALEKRKLPYSLSVVEPSKPSDRNKPAAWKQEAQNFEAAAAFLAQHL